MQKQEREGWKGIVLKFEFLKVKVRNIIVMRLF